MIGTWFCSYLDTEKARNVIGGVNLYRERFVINLKQNRVVLYLRKLKSSDCFTEWDVISAFFALTHDLKCGQF